MKQCYLIVNQEFHDAYDGYRKGASVLKTVTTADGRIALSLNAVNEFTELFEGVGQTQFTAVFLSAEDFPVVTGPTLPS